MSITSDTAIKNETAFPDSNELDLSCKSDSYARPVLEIRDLSISYRSRDGDVKAVESVNLVINPEEVVGLAGESGSGKSTLAYGACRLARPPAVITGGSVLYYGRRNSKSPVDILNLDRRELQALRWQEISIVFQSAMNALNPVLRVEEQLTDAMSVHLKLKKSESREKARGLLDLVGIDRKRLRSYPHELSGGMRQRVVIAMALCADPELVIMDEPTTALDVVLQREILSQIVELKSQLGFSVLFITHDLSLLMEIADKIAIMYAGQLVEVGSSRDIHHRPNHPYTRGLLNSFPSLRGPRRELTGIPGVPPDLRTLPNGCPFVPRCRYSQEQCSRIDMKLERVGGHTSRSHFSACPFYASHLNGINAGIKGDQGS